MSGLLLPAKQNIDNHGFVVRAIFKRQRQDGPQPLRESSCHGTDGVTGHGTPESAVGASATLRRTASTPAHPTLTFLATPEAMHPRWRVRDDNVATVTLTTKNIPPVVHIHLHLHWNRTLQSTLHRSQHKTTVFLFYSICTSIQMMTKIACLTTAVVALTVSVTVAAESFATTSNGATSSEHERQKNNPRQRRMKKGNADGAASSSPHQTSRTSHQTSRTSHHQEAPTQAHTTSRTSSHTPPKDTTRHERDDEWYDDYFLYFDDQFATAQPVDDAYYAGEAPIGVDDDRYYYQDDLQYMDDAYMDDAYYYGEPEPKASKKAKKSSKKSKKSSKKGKKDSLLNDDFYGNDD
jgi:hypothetical protein